MEVSQSELLNCYSEEHPSDLVQLGKQIGADNLNRVLSVLGGRNVYVPTGEQFWKGLYREIRNEEMRAKFRGNNIKELALEYDLDERQVRRIVNE